MSSTGVPSQSRTTSDGSTPERSKPGGSKADGGVPGNAARGFADHPLAQLTGVRFREFIREPEAMFWVFIFPILLAAGLGIAFRNRPADVLKVAAVSPGITMSLRQEKSLDVQEMQE